MQNPVVSRGVLEETAVVWHSQADRPDEGATDAEPGGVTKQPLGRL